MGADATPSWKPAAAGTIAIVAGRLALLPWLGVFNDEAYYWEWSRRLAAGYFDHPPAVAWIIAAIARPLGTTQLAVHLPAFLLSLLTSLALLRLVLDLFPGRLALAWTSVLALNTAPLFGIGAVFTTPDAPATLLWVVTALLVWRAVNGQPRLWYAAGIAGGLGLLSKYTFFLLPASILVFLLGGERRRWLARREPWLSGALMLLVFSPSIVWNARNGWPSFLYQLVGRHAEVIRPWITIPRYVAAQQALSPLLWLACLAGLVRSVRLAREGSAAHAYLVALSAVTLGFFGAVAVVAFVNPNWVGPGFLALLVSGVDVLLAARSRLVRRAPVALAAGLTAIFYAQALTAALPIPPNADLASDLIGWPAVAERLRTLAAGMPRPDLTFVFSRRLQLSAPAAFYLDGALEVTRYGGRDDAYDAWDPADGRAGRDAVYFCDDKWFAPPDEFPFARCVDAGALPIVRYGRTIRTYRFWTCTGFAGVHRVWGPSAAPR